MQQSSRLYDYGRTLAHLFRQIQVLEGHGCKAKLEESRSMMSASISRTIHIRLPLTRTQMIVS